MPSMTKDLITDLTANEINDRVFNLLKDYKLPMDDLVGVSSAHIENEIKNGNGHNLYYQWLACLTNLLNPKQVVELGAASGISTIMIATELPQKSALYSVDNDPTIAWKWMAKDYPQLVKILGDDLDLSIFPKGMELQATDLWFVDTLHTKKQLTKEIELYSPFWKQGAVVVFDDIGLPGMKEVWQSLRYDKYESNLLHYSGFGFIVI